LRDNANESIVVPQPEIIENDNYSKILSVADFLCKFMYGLLYRTDNSGKYAGHFVKFGSEETKLEKEDGCEEVDITFGDS
jgi:hypothetical protein